MPRKIPPYAPVIQYLRLTKEWTRKQLADRIGETEYYVGYLEDGYRYPRSRQLAALARAFGWSTFELALMADEAIPYPDWPAPNNLTGWYRLSQEWAAIVENIRRYALARTLWQHPEWMAQLVGDAPDVMDAVASYGLVAVYVWVRDTWQASPVVAAREQLPDSLEAMREALAGDATVPATGPQAPNWWAELTPQEQETVATLVRGMMASR